MQLWRRRLLGTIDSALHFNGKGYIEQLKMTPNFDPVTYPLQEY